MNSRSQDFFAQFGKPHTVGIALRRNRYNRRVRILQASSAANEQVKTYAPATSSLYKVDTAPRGAHKVHTTGITKNKSTIDQTKK